MLLGSITLVWFFNSSWLSLLSVCLKGALSSHLLPLEHDATADIYIYDVMMQLPLEQDAAILDKGAVSHLKEYKHNTCTSVFVLIIWTVI